MTGQILIHFVLQPPGHVGMESYTEEKEDDDNDKERKNETDEVEDKYEDEDMDEEEAEDEDEEKNEDEDEDEDKKEDEKMIQRDQSRVLAAVHLTPAPGATPSFSLLVRSLSMLFIRCLLTLVTISWNSSCIPTFISLGFLQMAFPILSSTLIPMAASACAHTLSSRRPLLGLAMDSNRSAIASGLTRLFSILMDLSVLFWSITEHRVATAKSDMSVLQAENFTSLSLFLRALKISQKSCSEMPITLLSETSFKLASFFCSFSRTSSGLVSFGGSGSKYWRGSAYASITKS